MVVTPDAILRAPIAFGQADARRPVEQELQLYGGIAPRLRFDPAISSRWRRRSPRNRRLDGGCVASSWIRPAGWPSHEWSAVSAASRRRSASSAELAVHLQRGAPGPVRSVTPSPRGVSSRPGRSEERPPPALRPRTAPTSSRSWQPIARGRAGYFGTTTQQINMLSRDEIYAEALQREPLTRVELADAVAADGLAYVDEALRYGELLKPLAWAGRGLLRTEPGRTRDVRRRRPGWNCAWPGLTDADEAAPVAIASYLRAQVHPPRDLRGARRLGRRSGRARLRCSGSVASATGWPRSRSTASPPTCWPRTSTSSSRRARREPSSLCTTSTNTSSVPRHGERWSYRPHGGSR